MPPQRPARLRAFLGAIARHIALDRFDRNRAGKRSSAAMILEEFAECIPDRAAPVADRLIWEETVNRFLASLDQKTRTVFVRRYWYLCPVRQIARSMGLTESCVKVMLHRTRNRFRDYLGKEGISV